MKTVINIRNFLLPQFKNILQELPDQKLGDHVEVLDIGMDQWNTFYQLKPGDTYGYGRILGKGYKKVDIDDVNVQKSSKVTIVYRVDEGIGEDKIIKIKLAFHGEFPNDVPIQNLSEVDLPIDWAIICYDGSAKKLTKHKWS